MSSIKEGIRTPFFKKSVKHSRENWHDHGHTFSREITHRKVVSSQFSKVPKTSLFYTNNITIDVYWTSSLHFTESYECLQNLDKVHINWSSCHKFIHETIIILAFSIPNTLKEHHSNCKLNFYEPFKYKYSTCTQRLFRITSMVSDSE